MFDCRRLVEATVAPLAEGRYIEDWQSRAAQAGAISDYYTIRLRGSPFFELEDAGLGGPVGSDTPLRKGLQRDLKAAMDQASIAYDFSCVRLAPTDERVFGHLYHEVDSVEKMAMSAIAHAICKLAPPMPAMLALCNLLSDEALHLMALTALLGIRQDELAWITPKREPFWRLLRSADDLVCFLFWQNCLSETEGCLAAAEKLVQLREARIEGVAMRVAYRILVEETNHALAGYQLVKSLDADLGRNYFEDLLGRYLSVEKLGDSNTAHGKRQRFSLGVAEGYVESRNLTDAHARILNGVRTAAQMPTATTG